MIFINAALQLVTLMACVALLAIVEPALNRCSMRTRRCIRLSLLLLGAGALLTIAALIPYGIPTPWPGAASLTCGVALLLFTSRRRRLRP